MYKYSKFPTQIAKQEYDSQEQDFINFLKKIPSVKSVYSIGELGLYGVSDLDYLIVHQGECSKEDIENFTRGYNLIDTVLFLDNNQIDTQSYISHHINYSLVYGDDIGLTFDKNNKNLNIIYAWRVCFVSLLRNFYFYKTHKNIKVKNLLSQINDIRYPVFFLENLGVYKEEYKKFLDDFSQYRKSYFEHQDYQKLEVFLEATIPMSWDIISELQKYLPVGQEETYFYGRFTTIFEKLPSIGIHRRKTEQKLRYIGKFSRFLYLPTGFDFRKWEGKLEEDLKIIAQNNNNFLDFSLPSYKGKILLFLKKIVDYIYLRFFKIEEKIPYKWFS